MTLAVPTAAMIVLPRSFGLALLAGGLTNDVANASFYTTTSSSSSEFGILVLILFVLAIVLAVRRPDRNAPAPTGPAEPA